MNRVFSKANDLIKNESGFYKNAGPGLKMLIGLRILCGTIIAVITGIFFILYALLSDVPPPPVHAEISLLLFFGGLFFSVFLLLLRWRFIIQKKRWLVLFFLAGILNMVFPYCGAYIIFTIFADDPPTVTAYYSYFTGENPSSVSVYITAMILPVVLMVVFYILAAKKSTNKD